MQGYSPKLPLKKDSLDGFATNKTLLDTIKQDFKMLMLTNPGERMMIPDYGVGLRSLLFSQNTDILKEQINNRIYDQISKYMNFINLLDIQITTSQINENMLNVLIKYEIPTLNAVEELNLSLSSN